MKKASQLLGRQRQSYIQTSWKKMMMTFGRAGWRDSFGEGWLRTWERIIIEGRSSKGSQRFKDIRGAVNSHSDPDVSKLTGPWVKSSPPPFFVNKFLLEYWHLHSFMYCVWLWWHNWVVAKKMLYPTKPKIFATWISLGTCAPGPGYSWGNWVSEGKSIFGHTGM